MIRECKICGRPFIAKVANQEMCSEQCRAISKKQYAAKINAELRAATKERLGTYICVVCGREYHPANSLKVTCSPQCQTIRSKQLARENMRTIRQAQKNKRNRNTFKATVEINARAREMGMSYGQYVAYMEGKLRWHV